MVEGRRWTAGLHSSTRVMRYQQWGDADEVPEHGIGRPCSSVGAFGQANPFEHMSRQETSGGEIRSEAGIESAKKNL